MKNHLLKKHDIEKKELVQEKKAKTTFPDSDAANKMLYVLWLLFLIAFSPLLQLISSATFVAEGHIPLIIVENEAFIKFLRILEPSYTPPSRYALRNIVIQEADLVLEKVWSFNLLSFFSSFSKIAGEIHCHQIQVPLLLRWFMEVQG